MHIGHTHTRAMPVALLEDFFHHVTQLLKEESTNSVLEGKNIMLATRLLCSRRKKGPVRWSPWQQSCAYVGWLASAGPLRPHTSGALFLQHLYI